MQPNAGLVISKRFRLVRHLGSGGMGTVWSAMDTRMQRPVALKMLTLPAHDRAERRRFVREALAASAVRHPHVIQILDLVDADDGAPVLVMELLEGETLKDLLQRRGPLALAEGCAILLAVASAVRAAHARGIVHRDLKPANIFLARLPDGTVSVKVLDFGIAKWTRQAGNLEPGDLTRTGCMLGSPPYMSPEQAFCDKGIDHRTDVWSLGIVLYECLSGILPTRADNTGQTLKIIAKGGIPRLAQVIPWIPGDLADLVDRMLSEAPGSRPSDLSEVERVIARHAGAKLPSLTPPAERSPGSVTSAEQAAEDTRSSIARTLRKPSGRIQTRWVGLLVILALAATSRWFWREHGGAPAMDTAASPAEAAPTMTPSATSDDTDTEASRPAPVANATPEPAAHPPTSLSAVPRKTHRIAPQPSSSVPRSVIPTSAASAEPALDAGLAPPDQTDVAPPPASTAAGSRLPLDVNNPYPKQGTIEEAGTTARPVAGADSAAR